MSLLNPSVRVLTLLSHSCRMLKRSFVVLLQSSSYSASLACICCLIFCVTVVSSWLLISFKSESCLVSRSIVCTYASTVAAAFSYCSWLCSCFFKFFSLRSETCMKNCDIFSSASLSSCLVSLLDSIRHLFSCSN